MNLGEAEHCILISRAIQILDLVQQAVSYKQLKKGANEGQMGCTSSILPYPNI
jgi:hypothetical protein